VVGNDVSEDSGQWSLQITTVHLDFVADGERY
jgi:hypothetical protein